MWVIKNIGNVEGLVRFGPACEWTSLSPQKEIHSDIYPVSWTNTIKIYKLGTSLFQPLDAPPRRPSSGAPRAKESKGEETVRDSSEETAGE